MSPRLLLLGSRAAQLVLMFLVVKVQSTLLVPAQLAQLSLVLAANAFFALVLLNPVGTFYNRHLMAWNLAGSLYPAVLRMIVYLLVLSTLAGFFYFLISRVQGSEVFRDLDMILMASGLFLLSSVVNFLLPSLNLLEKNKAFAAFLTLNAVLLLCLPVIFFELGEQSVLDWLAGLLSAGFLTALPLWFVFKKQIFHGSFKSDSKAEFTLLQALKFSFPVLLSTLMLWGVFHGYRFLVEYKIGLAELGWLFAGYGLCVQLFGAAEVLVNSLFMPKLYKESSTDKRHRDAFAQYFRGLLVTYSVGVFVVVTGSEYLMRIFLGPGYQSVGGYIQIGAAIEYFRVLANAISFRYHLSHKTRGLIIPSIGFMLSFIAVASVSVSATDVLLAILCATVIYLLLLAYPYARELFDALRSDLLRSYFIVSLIPLAAVVYWLLSESTYWYGAVIWALVSSVLCLFVVKRYLLSV